MRRGSAAVLLLCHVAGMADMVAMPLWIGALMQTYGLSAQHSGLAVTVFLLMAAVASSLLSKRFDIRALAQGLPQIVKNPEDLAARSDCLYGAWLCGTVLGNVGMALHHKLCHTLGGSFNLPHSETHTIVLPHALAYNAEAAPEAMQRIARALHVADAAQGMFDLAESLGAPTSLKDIGMPADELDRCADISTQNAYANPRLVEKGAIRALLECAYQGRRP